MSLNIIHSFLSKHSLFSFYTDFSSNCDLPGTILNIKDIAVNKENNFPAFRKLTFWWYETEKAFNDCSNVSMHVKDQVSNAGWVREKKM